jgi:hypothetical protein
VHRTIAIETGVGLGIEVERDLGLDGDDRDEAARGSRRNGRRRGVQQLRILLENPPLEIADLG